MNCIFCNKKAIKQYNFATFPNMYECIHGDIHVVYFLIKREIHVIRFEDRQNSKSIILYPEQEGIAFHYKGMQVLYLHTLLDINPENMIQMYNRYTSLVVFS